MRDYHSALGRASKKADCFLKKIFTNIEVSAPEDCENDLKQNPTMVVSSHRSHIDYILIGITLNKLALPNLRFAAGDNLTNMPYIGKKFRSWGAFSVYRSQAMKRSYILKLSQQVVKMLSNGDNIVVFPEGGRSYSGEMLDIKGGVIASAIFAQYKNPELNVKYLPIAVSYEKLPEIRYFDLLLKGKNLLLKNSGLIKKNIGKFLYFGADLIAFAKFLFSKQFNRKYGSVYIDIGNPISINKIINIQKNYNSTSQSQFAAHKKSLEETAVIIKNEITKLYRILPLHIVAKILSENETIAIQKMEKQVLEILISLEKKDMNLKTISELSFSEIITKGIEQLNYTNSIQVRDKCVSIKNKSFINYYSAIIR